MHHDRGITVVFFAIGISAMLTVGALVLGAGVGYSAARDSQTAADAAALAGASLLQNHKQDWIQTEASDVHTEVENVAAANGAILERCDLIFAGYALSGTDADVSASCTALGGLSDEVFQAVAGVRVTVREVRDVAFASFVDQDQITVRATAAATIQPVATGRAPFMVCAFADGHPAEILVESSEDRTGYDINDAAIDKFFVLWGNHIKYLGRDCGNGSSDWRGLINHDQDFSVNGWWDIEYGNSIGVELDFAPMVASDNACSLNDEPLTELEHQPNCQIALPLCIEGRKLDDPNYPSGKRFQLRCVKMGVFEISHVGNNMVPDDNSTEYETPCGATEDNIICGRFIGASTGASGRGYAAPPDRHEFSVVKLVE